jgi:hypothetical protein
VRYIYVLLLLLLLLLLLFVLYFTTPFNNLGCIASNERAINLGFGRKLPWPNIKALSRHSPGRIEENEEKL